MLYSKDLPILKEAQVVIAGAGSAGVAAAIQAARNGAKVLLLEKNNCAGGLISSGLLPSIIHLSYGKELPENCICRELIERVAKKMNTKINYHWFNIHAEVIKKVLDEMLFEAGVEVLYNVHICDVIANDKKIQALSVCTTSGMSSVCGEIFIDTTGDAYLSALANVPIEYGNENNETMAPTLCSFFSGINFDKMPEELRNKGLGRKEWKAAMDENRTPLSEGHFVGIFRNGKTTASGNLGHIYGTDVLDVQSTTQAVIEGRKQAWIFQDFFRENLVGAENIQLEATASQLGIRESRRIVGEYVLNFNDYVDRKHFADDIGSFAYGIDIHSSKSNIKEQQQVEKKLSASNYEMGECYGIPYRALLPKNTKNLLVAGRCISTDRAMQSSIRVVPCCMLTGQAAGSAASIAIKSKNELRNIDIKLLQQLQK